MQRLDEVGTLFWLSFTDQEANKQTKNKHKTTYWHCSAMMT